MAARREDSEMSWYIDTIAFSERNVYLVQHHRVDRVIGRYFNVPPPGPDATLQTKIKYICKLIDIYDALVAGKYVREQIDEIAEVLKGEVIESIFAL